MSDLYHQFKLIRENSKLKFYDSHTHPVDVLGVVNDISLKKREISSLKPSLLETMKYNNTVLNLLDFLFKQAPWYIKKSIKNSYKGVNKDFFVKVLEDAGIDVATLLPVAPYTDSDKLYSFYKDEGHFINLGSIDVHSINYNDIEQEIERQVKKYNIKGIKFHPNFQRFFPQPSQNKEPLKSKLINIYKALNKYKLYALFHGGNSYIPNQRNTFDKVDYAKIENYLTKDSNEDLFGLIKTPIIIAHFGNYNVKNPTLTTLEKILNKYPHVYTDTAAVSPKLIYEFIAKNGVSRVVFGSDTVYFNLRYNIQLILDILKETPNDISFGDKVLSVFSKNYFEVLNSC